MSNVNEQSTGLLLAKIKSEFPSVSWKKHRIIRDGWDHDVVILDDRFVFRFPKKKDSLKQFAVEMQLMDQIPKTTLAIPRYIYKSSDGLFGGYKLIKGQELTPRLYRLFPEETKTIAIKQIAKFLTQLHATPTAPLEKFGLKKSNSVQETRRWQKKLLQRVAVVLSKKQLALIDRYFYILLSEQKDLVTQGLIHGDFSGDHLLINETKTRLTGVIDFSDRAIADPAMDFARLWSFGPKMVSEIYKSYHGKKDDRFLLRSKLYRLGSSLHTLYGAVNGHADLKKTLKEFDEEFVKEVEKIK